MVVFVGLPVRIILDVASSFRPHPSFNAAYASLFVIFGVAALFSNDRFEFGLLSLGLAVWYLYRLIVSGVRRSD